MKHLRRKAFNHSASIAEKSDSCLCMVLTYFFGFGGMWLLSASMAPSILCWLFQKSFHRSPFSLSRAKIDLMFKFSGCKFGFSSRGKTGAETGALGNARTL